MSKIRVPIAMLVVLLIATAASSTVASGATAGWMTNGTLLSGSKGLMKTAQLTTRPTLSAAGITIECLASTVEVVKGEITSPAKGAISSLVFKECIIAESGQCSLSGSTFSTVPITMSEITLDGVLAIAGKVVPQTKNVFATLKFEGASCPLLGTQAITGSADLLASSGQDERTQQPFSMFSLTGSLKVGASEATFKVTSELATEPLAPWSFL